MFALWPSHAGQQQQEAEAADRVDRVHSPQLQPAESFTAPHLAESAEPESVLYSEQPTLSCSQLFANSTPASSTSASQNGQAGVDAATIELCTEAEFGDEGGTFQRGEILEAQESPGGLLTESPEGAAEPRRKSVRFSAGSSGQAQELQVTFTIHFPQLFIHPVYTPPRTPPPSQYP